MPDIEQTVSSQMTVMFDFDFTNCPDAFRQNCSQLQSNDSNQNVGKYNDSYFFNKHHWNLRYFS